MSVTDQPIVAENSTPTFPKVLTIVASGGGTAAGVQGVKGSAETTYRDGYVNITPANLGFQIVEITTASGTLSADVLSVLTGNPHNFMGYADTETGAKYIYQLASITNDTRIYTAIKQDLSGTMYISLNSVTGVYSYSYLESAIKTALNTHINNTTVHFTGQEKTETETSIQTVAANVTSLEETVENLTTDGGEVK